MENLAGTAPANRTQSITHSSKVEHCDDPGAESSSVNGHQFSSRINPPTAIGDRMKLHRMRAVMTAEASAWPVCRPRGVASAYLGVVACFLPCIASG